MQLETPGNSIDTLYASTSRKCRSFDDLFLHDFPTSPTRDQHRRDFSADDAQRKSEFEFDTSLRFAAENVDAESTGEKTRESRYGDAEGIPFPAMAFADELFCDGKMMPLKPPPRLQALAAGNIGSAASPPKPSNPGFRLRPRRNLQNEDFDPFMVALENVTEEDGRKMRGKGCYSRRARARSMSPLRPRAWVRRQSADLSGWTEGPGHWSGPYLRSPNRAERRGVDGFSAEQSPQRLPPEPKGVTFARHVRIHKEGVKQQRRHIIGSVPKPKIRAGRRPAASGETHSGTKWQKMKKFLFGNAALSLIFRKVKQRKRTGGDEHQRDSM